ncbi:MAG: Rid family hydrolase [Candidatus Dormibacterales bacterium]
MNRQVVQRGPSPSPIAVYLSDAIRTGPFVFASGLLVPTDPQDSPYHNQVRAQTELSLKGLEETLAAGGSSLQQAVYLRTWHTGYRDFPAYLEARRPFMTVPPAPGSAIRSGLVRRTAEIEIEVTGLVPGQGAVRRVVHSDRVPPPLVPGAHAVEAGPFIFTAGITAADGGGPLAPAATVPPGLPHFASAVKRQTGCVLDRLGHILEAAGSGLGDVVRAQVLLRSHSDFFAFDEAWRTYFPADPPARTVLESDILHPQCLVQVEVIALSPGSGLHKEAVHAPRAPVSVTAESQAVRAGEYVFVSGILPTDFETGVAGAAQVAPEASLYEDPIVPQVRHVLTSLKEILEAAGSSLENVVRVGAYHTDLARDLLGAMAVRREFFPGAPPASTTVEVGSLAVPGCLFMYDALAVVPS